MNRKEITADKNLVAYCGLYCGACGKYLMGKCSGCRDNVKATWCKVRECCIQNNHLSCADCTTIELKDCKKYNNFMFKLVGYILRSDRSACICRIREIGYDNFAFEMAEKKMQTIRKH
ncbi:MAG: DUF3795 domain-containing protein [Bacteroidia bacterium]|nr:DUF3795 domain-containing protein [Bacteroidia bacterium]